MNIVNTLKKNKVLNSIMKPVTKQYRKRKYQKYLASLGLNGKISYKDAMFDNITHYIAVGESAMVNIENALKASGKTFASLNEVLDIPSGHGRVLRLLVTKVPPERVTACDIDEDGINFCKKEFGCKKMLSSADISTIQFPVNYSLIWVGSLFTHLDKKAFSDLLVLLFNALEPGGVLVFTTHGKYSVEIFEKYWLAEKSAPVSNEQLQKELEKTNGFYFAPYANSKDYGISVSLKPYVINLIETLFQNKAKVVMYKERGWDDHQDVFAIQKLH
ncbi:MAG TPA: class I SAM-dependent methyltransferase [Chitinophagaceae bacterium]|nr:class I SAM-dependent methyltransferase [Chitinophagaceae bacterium]